MTNYVPVSQKRHAGKFWQRYDSYLFTVETHIAPIVAEELPRACRNLPIAFVPHQDSFLLVAVLSPFPGRNLFVNSKGQWLGNYVPACFRGYPFQLARVKDQSGMVLCVDEDSGLISETNGEPFFDEKGNTAKPVQDVLDFLQKVEQNRNITTHAVSALHNAGVITPWPLKTSDGDQQKNIDGLYKIDEAMLNNLEDDAFLTLRKAASLPLAYAHLLSQINLDMLHRLMKVHEKAEPASTPATQDIDIEKMFGDDDIFKF